VRVATELEQLADRVQRATKPRLQPAVPASGADGRLLTTQSWARGDWRAAAGRSDLADEANTSGMMIQ